MGRDGELERMGKVEIRVAGNIQGGEEGVGCVCRKSVCAGHYQFSGITDLSQLDAICCRSRWERHDVEHVPVPMAVIGSDEDFPGNLEVRLSMAAASWWQHYMDVAYCCSRYLALRRAQDTVLHGIHSL